MPGWLKALIIIAIIIVLLVLGVVGAGVFWWMRNKDALKARAQEVVAEGQEVGKNSDNQGCVDAGVARYKKEPGFVNAISTSIFMNTCLRVSKPTPGFCETVPRATEFMKSKEWQAEQCQRVDLSTDSYCRQIFQPVQQFCEEGKRKSTATDNANSQ